MLIFKNDCMNYSSIMLVFRKQQDLKAKLVDSFKKPINFTKKL